MPFWLSLRHETRRASGITHGFLRRSLVAFHGGLRRAPLTVLSPGPRLAGTPSKGRKVMR